MILIGRYYSCHHGMILCEAAVLANAQVVLVKERPQHARRHPDTHTSALWLHCARTAWQRIGHWAQCTRLCTWRCSGGVWTRWMNCVRKQWVMGEYLQHQLGGTTKEAWVLRVKSTQESGPPMGHAMHMSNRIGETT
jgi:hypothetical protein